MRGLRLLSLCLVVVLMGCGNGSLPGDRFDFSQRGYYQSATGQDTTFVGVLQGASRPESPPGGAVAGARGPALQAAENIPSVDGNYQLVLENGRFLLLGSFPELQPYIGRPVTVVGKVVVLTFFDGTTSTQLAPHFVIVAGQ